jgi:hypothetical protein
MNQRAGALLVLLAGTLARWTAIDVRPMHADEGILADITATLRDERRFSYTASDYHGPVLPALGALMPGRISETSLRSVTALAGVVLALVITHAFGVPAGMLVAGSPALVYWSRFYIPELVLALLSALWLLTILRASAARDWAVAGLLAAAMIATKETAVLAFVAAAAAWILSTRPAPQPRHLAVMSAVAAVLATCVITGGFQQWREVMRLPQALLARAAGSGHEHPAWWYFSVLRWELLAIPLAALSWRRDRFLASYTLALALLYCAIPYKTPWCAVQFWWPVLALAGYRPKPAYALAAATGVIAVFTSFLHPASPANPYAYSQTLPEALQVPRQLARLGGNSTPVQFFTQMNLWPLPWYLRSMTRQQWRRDVDFNAKPAPLIVVTPELEPKLTEWLYERQLPGDRELYMRVFDRPVCLRPGVEVRLYCAKTLWDAAQRP